MFFISRPLGIAVAVYSCVFIFMARLYVGLHWPTDIMAGVMLGAGIAWVAMLPRMRELFSRPAFWALDRYPGLFYTGAFVVTYQVAVLFGDLRRSRAYVVNALERVV